MAVREVATIVAHLDVEVADVPTQDRAVPAIARTTRLTHHPVEVQLLAPMEVVTAVDPIVTRADGDVKTFRDAMERLLADAEELTTAAADTIAIRKVNLALVLHHHADAEEQIATANDVTVKDGHAEEKDAKETVAVAGAPTSVTTIAIQHISVQRLVFLLCARLVAT